MEIWKINPKKISQSDIKKMADFLRQGKIMVLPTDTVYGLIADAANKKAAAKIFKIKKRSEKKPLLVFAKNIKSTRKIAELSREQERFLRKRWPGKTTAILNARGKHRTNGRTIGVRIPNYPLVVRVLKETGFLFQTSANISGEPANYKIKEIIKIFEKEKNQPDIIIDAGNLRKEKPSTVIDLTGKKPKILRR